MVESWDAIVIGAGQAGPSLAVRLANAGRRVALIERERLGGTCVNNGCIPTKTLVASARVAHVVRTAQSFGVTSAPPTVDLAAVKARKDAVVQQSRDGLGRWIGATKGLELIIGEGRFVAERTVAVGDRELTAPLVVINTGGRPVVPDWPGLDRVPYLTNVEMMELDRLPEHLIVAGGSYIGLEFAQMYRRFGARVTVVEYADRLIAREDDDVSAAVRSLLESEGIDVHVGARDFSVAGSAGDLRLHFTSQGTPVGIEGSHLLLATGRRPNVERLNLQANGVAQDARGFVTVDARLATSVPGIYALGDVNGRGAFTHTSYNDYEILVANLLDQGDRTLDARLTAYALYTDPPLARVGLTAREALASGRRILRGTLPMQRVGRARERGETTGFMSILVDAETDLIVGATLFGIEADEVIHVLLHAMAAGRTATQFRQVMPVHPTVSELLPTLLEQLSPLQ